MENTAKNYEKLVVRFVTKDLHTYLNETKLDGPEVTEVPENKIRVFVCMDRETGELKVSKKPINSKKMVNLGSFFADGILAV